MSADLSDLKNVKISELKNIISKFIGIDVKNKNRKQLESIIDTYYRDIKKFIFYTFVKKLGAGKHGEMYLVSDNRTNKKYAMKIFKKSEGGGGRSAIRIEKQVEIQQIAWEAGLSPKIRDYDSQSGFIVMDVLKTTLYDLFIKQGKELTLKQQRDVISVCKRLDACGIFHGDPNPANFMYLDKKLYVIDFGFSTRIDDKCVRNWGREPNSKNMTKGLIVHLRRINSSCKLKIFEEHLARKFTTR